MAKVRIDIDGNASGLDRALSHAGKGLDAFKSKVGMSFGGMFAGLAGGATVAAMANNMADFALNIKHGAENLGITTKRMQELRTVAKHAGKDMDAFSGIFRKANEFGSKGQVKGSKQANIAERLGLTQSDLHNLSTDELVKKALKGTAGMSGATAKNLLKEVVGKDSAGWLYNKRDEYTKGGGPVVEDSELNKMADLKEMFEDLIDVIRTVVIPAFISMAEWLINLVGSYAKATKTMDDLDSEAQSIYSAKHNGESISAAEHLAKNASYQTGVAAVSANPFQSKESKDAMIARMQKGFITSMYGKDVAEETFKTVKYTPDTGVMGKLSGLQDKWKERADKRKAEQASLAADNAGSAGREAAIGKTTKPKSLLDNELKGANNPFLKIGGLMGIDSSYRLQGVAEATNKILMDIYKVLLAQQQVDDTPGTDGDQN